MSDSQSQVTQEVSTESQRQALDEMSRQLVERLNDMVREQNERAERFAATQHSLSPLPELPDIDAGNPNTPATEPPPVAPPPAAPEKKMIPLRPFRPTQDKKPQDFSAQPIQPKDLVDWLNKQPGEDNEKKAEESGCGTVPTIIFIVIIIIILRACS